MCGKQHLVVCKRRSQEPLRPPKFLAGAKPPELSPSFWLAWYPPYVCLKIERNSVFHGLSWFIILLSMKLTSLEAYPKAWIPVKGHVVQCVNIYIYIYVEEFLPSSTRFWILVWKSTHFGRLVTNDNSSNPRTKWTLSSLGHFFNYMSSKEVPGNIMVTSSTISIFSL